MTALEETTPVKKVLRFDIIEKSAAGSDEHFVAGWASVSYRADGEPLVDTEGDFIPLATLRKAMHRYFDEFRVGGEMHEGDAPNHASEMVVTDLDVQKAWAHDCPSCGTRIEKFLPQAAWIRIECGKDLVEKVQKGTRLQFSIEGRSKRRRIA